MNQDMCGATRESIPDYVGGRLQDFDAGAVERHVAGCRECEAELALARSIFASRAAVPDALLDRLLVSLARERQPARTWWGISAAAVAALALGIGIASDPSAVAPVDVPGFAYEVQEGDIWVSDDGLLAGAPMFDGLSDDALMQLLNELSVESAGGSA
jgi:anti-sigma factor RsiW